MEDKMEAGAFGRDVNYGLDGPFKDIWKDGNYELL